MTDSALPRVQLTYLRRGRHQRPRFMWKCPACNKSQKEYGVAVENPVFRALYAATGRKAPRLYAVPGQATCRKCETTFAAEL